jgi:hypothetical protein
LVHLGFENGVINGIVYERLDAILWYLAN